MLEFYKFGYGSDRSQEKTLNKFSDRPGQVEKSNLVVFKLPTTTKFVECLMNYNRSPMDSNESCQITRFANEQN